MDWKNYIHHAAWAAMWSDFMIWLIFCSVITTTVIHKTKYLHLREDSKMPTSWHVFIARIVSEILFLKHVLIYMSACVCCSAYICAHGHSGACRGQNKIPWSWSYRQLLGIVRVQGIEHRLSVWKLSILNCTISLVQQPQNYFGSIPVHISHHLSLWLMAGWWRTSAIDLT